MERSPNKSGAHACIDLVGSKNSISLGIRILRPRGCLSIVGISNDSRPLENISPYRDILGGEKKILGVSDHTKEDIILLLKNFALLDFKNVISNRICLDGNEINNSLDRLRKKDGNTVRSVIQINRKNSKL